VARPVRPPHPLGSILRPSPKRLVEQLADELDQAHPDTEQALPIVAAALEELEELDAF
jgi:hypothetical protein